MIQAVFTIEGVRQVKVPVTDLGRSVDWYCALLGMHLIREFVEDGAPAGATIAHPTGGFIIGLRIRDRIDCRPPAMPGFDLFSLQVSGPEDLTALSEHCESLGISHAPVVDRGSDGQALDVADPDGTVIRFLTPMAPDAPAFGGVEFDQTGRPSFYDNPRLGRNDEDRPDQRQLPEERPRPRRTNE